MFHPNADLMVIKDFSEWSFYKFEPFVELGADQLSRFEDQLKLSEKGDEEAMFIGN